MTSSKHGHANYGQFAKHLLWPIRRYVSVTNLKLFESMEIELRAKEAGEFSVMLCETMGLWAFFLPTNMAAAI